jgi:hypothetical protein
MIRSPFANFYGFIAPAIFSTSESDKFFVKKQFLRRAMISVVAAFVFG